MRDLRKQFEDKAFVKAYFAGVTDGNDVTARLNADDATLSSPDLIASLVKWLAEAEPEDESDEDARERASQEMRAANLPSRNKEEDSEKKKEAATTSEKGGSGSEASDGTSREPGSRSGGLFGR